MDKVVLLLACILVVIQAGIIPLDDKSATPSNDNACKYKDELWGSEDGLKFYFCLTDNDTSIAIEQTCPEDTFFVRNATITGCVPNQLMEPNCVYTTAVGNCTGENLKQPQVSSDPSKFYLCTSEGATPLLLPCPEGKAFVKQNGYLGCFKWAQYRTLRQCYTLSNNSI